MAQLAILGGTPAVQTKLEPYKSIGKAEEEMVLNVVRSGCLSGFYGSWDDAFYGGPRVREFEEKWALRFKTKHAVSVNSNTSGLYAAMGAIGIGPGDEVIVSPYTMSATAVAPIGYGGIPVFADIEEETFGLDPKSVEKLITSKTKAILVTNIFGHGARLHELRLLADKNNIFLVEDNAQGPLAEVNGRYCGTIGHIGVFSLNYHKHIHTGEGGMCVTDNDELALRLKMIRNHAEAVAGPAKIADLTNMFGFNFRLTELSAAVGLAQLQSIDEHVGRRETLAKELSTSVQGTPGVIAPAVRENCRHVYYTWTLRVEPKTLGISRATFSKALVAEGFPHGVGYLKPLYMLPMFQKKIAMVREGFPFNLSNVSYAEGLCPTTERMHYQEVIIFEPCAYDATPEVISEFKLALKKVCSGIADLQRWEKSHT